MPTSQSLYRIIKSTACHTRVHKCQSTIQINPEKHSNQGHVAGAAAAPASACATFQFLGRQLAAPVPLIGLGLAALGRPGYINLGHNADLIQKDVQAMRQHCWTVLDAAWASGIRYFDTARSYGKAEDFLGSWLIDRGIPADQVLIGSKWGYYYTAGSTVYFIWHSPLWVAAAPQAAETFQNLGQHLDLYQIHSATLESGVLQAVDVLNMLAELQQHRGWQMGLSVSGVQQSEVISQAVQVAVGGKPLFSSIQATWNLLEQSAGPALQAAFDGAGCQIIIKEAMANGRLTARNNRPEVQHKLAVLQCAAQQLDTTVDALAIACVLKQPWKPLVLSGAATMEQLHSNLAALELVDRLEDEVVAELQRQLVQDPHEYWQERSNLAWN
eukprot:gene1565-1905_t